KFNSLASFLKKQPDRLFAASSEEKSQKLKEIALKSGRTTIINGKTLKEIAAEKNCGYTTLQQIFKKTQNEQLIEEFTTTKTSIEQVVEQILVKHQVQFLHDKQLTNSKYRPDFLIPSHNLIIECDGLYWHNEASGKHKSYHKDKKQEYKDLGYNSIFFRRDEILNKSET